MKRYIITAAAVGIPLLIAVTCLFSVNETEYAIVTTFGRPTRVVLEPGLNLKLPSPIQIVLRLDKRLQLFDAQPSEYLTQDRKNLVVDSYACWRIEDPQQFLVKVGTVAGAENSLRMILASELNSELGKYELSDLLSEIPEQVKLGEITSTVRNRCRTAASSDYGIEVVDVGIRRLNLPYQNKESVYERMRAEREQKAKQYRAEGEEQATAIRSKTEFEKRSILSQAYKEAQAIKGRGDAEALRIYAAAYRENPDFYEFFRTLSAYGKILGKDTTVVMSADNNLLKLLTDFDPAQAADEIAQDGQSPNSIVSDPLPDLDTVLDAYSEIDNREDPIALPETSSPMPVPLPNNSENTSTPESGATP